MFVPPLRKPMKVCLLMFQKHFICDKGTYLNIFNKVLAHNVKISWHCPFNKVETNIAVKSDSFWEWGGVVCKTNPCSNMWCHKVGKKQPLLIHNQLTIIKFASYFLNQEGRCFPTFHELLDCQQPLLLLRGCRVRRARKRAGKSAAVWHALFA